jgi:hypothetical protein
VVTALQRVQTRSLTRASILGAAEALLGLHARLERDLDQVRAARPLLIAGTRTATWRQPGRPASPPSVAVRALKLAADLYGPSGATRRFLAFQNPAELRGTGG